MTAAGGFVPGQAAARERPGGVAPHRCAVHPLPLPPMMRELRGVDAAPVPTRAKLAGFNANLHCSIVGTCLTTAELRGVLVKLKLVDAKASEHELHRVGVTAAGGRGIGAKMLNKALDRKFARHIGKFGKAKSEADVVALWNEALEAGDIPGAYWATLTHPATTDATVSRAFGEIHMLSHLVGAANRADIKRLRELESENETLRDKAARQQAALQSAVTSRDKRIRELEGLLVAALETRGADAAPPVAPSDAAALQDVLVTQAQRLSRAQARTAQIESRNRELERRLAAIERANGAAADECAALRAECATLERALLEADETTLDSPTSPLDLGGTTILYVGGRANQVAHLRRAVEEANGSFLHHSGGSEDNPVLLPGYVSRADLVVFPVDCVSHQAMHELKRHCRQAAKTYLPLRTASVAALLLALDRTQLPRLADAAVVP
jgi:hypothetical protein